MNETDVIRVRYWAAARAASGTAEDLVEADAPVRLGELLEQVLARHPGTRLREVVGVCSVLIDDRPVGREDPATVVVPPGASVELLPPFAGG